MTAPMTPERLATARGNSQQSVPYVDHVWGPSEETRRADAWMHAADLDRRHLLAEVDRLEAKNAEGWFVVARLNLRLRSVAAALDRYSNDQRWEDLESPEDAWRLFRDLRAALASDGEVQP